MDEAIPHAAKYPKPRRCAVANYKGIKMKGAQFFFKRENAVIFAGQYFFTSTFKNYLSSLKQHRYTEATKCHLMKVNNDDTLSSNHQGFPIYRHMITDTKNKISVHICEHLSERFLSHSNNSHFVWIQKNNNQEERTSID